MIQQHTTRRDFLTAAIVGGAATLTFGESAAAAPTQVPMRVGMTDWSMQKRGDITAFERAHLIGLDGVEVSLNTGDDHMFLRDPKMQEKYRRASHHWGVDIPSVAIGEMNRVPLKSEPIAAIWLSDCIECARNLGARNILMAFFSKGELFPDNTIEMDRVVEVLKALAPKAEDYGVTLGLENTISARDNMRIMDRVKSPALRVYYDVRNSWDNGFDCPEEIRWLGKENICQVHLKNGAEYMEDKELCDWQATSAAFRDIKYDGWYILETRSPSKDVIADTKKNLAYVKRTFTVG